VIRLLVAVSALVAMEPAVAAVHRWVMHGRGWAWHRSHHRWQGRRIEANDLYPVVFAAATIATMAVGAAIEGLAALAWVAAGVTGYGIAYLVVHDLFIHERLGRLPGARSRYVRWVTAAHAVHHRSGREPYGFLVPRLAAASTISPASMARPPRRGQVASRSRTLTTTVSTTETARDSSSIVRQPRPPPAILGLSPPPKTIISIAGRTSWLGRPRPAPAPCRVL
jgi:beta-carotene 3-hydroxylase